MTRTPVFIANLPPGVDLDKFETAVRELFGPTYRGVPVPVAYRVDWGKELTAARAWRAGVDATLTAGTQMSKEGKSDA